MANLRHYKCEFYEVDAPENSCLFCKHCRDVFYDWNGPYAYGCRLTGKDGIYEAHFGFLENCENFEEED